MGVRILFFCGGGTPALAAERLPEIIETLRQYFTITEGIRIELHPEDVTIPLLQKPKHAGVTKISIGIQSFQKKNPMLLGRKHPDPAAMHRALKAVTFETVSMDFIFALPGQTFEDLKTDLDTAFTHGANHIAIYPFIGFTFTASPVQAMKKKEKRLLLDKITNYCLGQGYARTSIWTFSSEKNARFMPHSSPNVIPGNRPGGEDEGRPALFLIYFQTSYKSSPPRR